VLLRLAYLTVTNAIAALRLLPMSDRDKDVEILVLRHQISVLERRLGAGTRGEIRARGPGPSRRSPDVAAPRSPVPTVPLENMVSCCELGFCCATRAVAVTIARCC
jgi:hypothetical protein